jgi:hypothetical protein
MSTGTALYMWLGIAVFLILDAIYYSFAIRRLKKAPPRFWNFIPGGGFYWYVRSHARGSVGRGK